MDVNWKACLGAYPGAGCLCPRTAFRRCCGRRGYPRDPHPPSGSGASARAVEEDEEYEDNRDSVAEALIRWVPPITAILCAAIALCGFVYYQFVL